MDDDIDIEEHDVLDNPVIKFIFPDISVLKQEIQYFDEDCPVKEEPEFADTRSRSFPVPEDLQANVVVSNLPSCSHLSVTNIETKPQNVQVQPIVKSNKIILGSKPNIVTKSDSTEINSKTANEKTVKFKHPKVILQDIKSYLNNNGRYCHKCCTLFLTKGALFAHKSKVHEKNLTRPIKQNNVVETKRKCSICPALFSCSSNLSRHYKNIHKKHMGSRKKSEGKPNLNAECYVDNNELTSKKVSTRNMQKNKILSKKNIKMTDQENNQKVQTKEKLVSANSKATAAKENKNKAPIKESRMTLPAKRKISYSKAKNQTTNSRTQHNKAINSKQKVSEYIEDSSSKKDIKSGYVTRAKNNVFKDSNICLHCNEEFPDQKSLIDHMYEILNPKSAKGDKVTGYKNATIEKQEKKIANKEEDDTLFVCRHCSYYLPSIKAYFVHNIKFHKIEVFMEVKKEKFYAQCRYCPSKSINMTAHNKHIFTYHHNLMNLEIVDELQNDKEQQSEKKDINESTDIFFALESVLFECNKCNVCFLSSNIAQDHKRHMEMLINWKCSICNHILKQQYKETHMKQHSFTDSIKVIIMEEKPVNSVLYKCTKCAIHFSEEKYQEHYPKCGIDTTDSSYCKICDILVDKSDMIQHKFKHDELKEISDFIVVDSNIIVDTVTTRKKRASDAESEAPPRKRLYEQINCLTYCHTCKCYLSDMALKRKVHTEGSCSKIQKHVCNICGLVLTHVAMKTHRQRHKNEKKLRLQDYKFYDLQGKLILPPLPEYPHCESCGIHFLTKNAIKSHMCDETDFLTCDICNINLSETAYKLHMTFHFYFIKDRSNALCETSIPSVTHTTNNESKVSETKVKPEVTTDSVISKVKTDFKELANSVVTKTKPEKMLHQVLESSETSIKHNEPIITNSLIPNINAEVLQNRDTQKIELSKNKSLKREESVLVVYTCITCGIMIETYDEVIEHCWTHYNTREKDSSRKNKKTKQASSKTCDIKFDRSAFINRCHRNHPSADIKVMEFDPSYFSSENKVWVKHVFRTLPEDVAKKHVNKSIYQHEHRIKLEYIQTGLPNFNVYKCDKCGNCIDHDSVFKHAKDKCFKVRKHPCALCGLPFISTLSRNNHEKLHKGKYGLSLKTVTIILFNQSTDKIYNDGILCTTNQYILYQCRNCDGIEEKSRIVKHVCNVNSLAKCSKCGLLICKKEYEAHVSKHTNLPNYCSFNFKVILFGMNNIERNVTRKLVSSFSGTVYDYTLYKCKKCEICIKNVENSENHLCALHFDLERTLCSKCNLYFPSLKLHMRQHNTDPDFIRENMNVIIFEGSKKQHELTVKKEDDDIIAEKETLSEEDNRDTSIYSNVDVENEFYYCYSKTINTDKKIWSNNKDDDNDPSADNNGEESVIKDVNSSEFLKECKEKNANDIKDKNSDNIESEKSHSQKNNDDKGENYMDGNKETTLFNKVIENAWNNDKVMVADNLEENLCQDGTMASCTDKAHNNDDTNSNNTFDDVRENNDSNNEEKKSDNNQSDRCHKKKKYDNHVTEKDVVNIESNLFQDDKISCTAMSTNIDVENANNAVKDSKKNDANYSKEKNCGSPKCKGNYTKDDKGKKDLDGDKKAVFENNVPNNAYNDEDVTIVNNLDANLSHGGKITCANKANNSDDNANNALNDGKEIEKSEDDGKGKVVDLVILFKCKCGLHFLNKPNVIEHSKKCQPKSKMYKQNCSKCNFLFNPSELFSHLLVHHRDKTRVQQFTVIEFSEDNVQAR